MSSHSGTQHVKRDLCTVQCGWTPDCSIQATKVSAIVPSAKKAFAMLVTGPLDSGERNSIIRIYEVAPCSDAISQQHDVTEYAIYSELQEQRAETARTCSVPVECD